ncbi:AAA family ATPase, partial [Streptomyces calidiresistens]|nr:AAA family ATPase [Streptomyces calidiresistens]
LPIPDPALVVLIGPAGAGKSTLAARHFRPTEVVSSDACRALVADDPNDQAATGRAFALVERIVELRLAGGRTTVVDATNVRPEERAPWVRLARDHDLPRVAVVLDLPEEECLRRSPGRPGREDVPARAIGRQHKTMRRHAEGLAKEGFGTVHVLRSAAEVDAARLIRVPRPGDLPHLRGPFDLIGDVHGCLPELVTLLTRLGWVIARDGRERAVGARHPEGRTAVFVGDLVDRGPDSPGVVELVAGMRASGDALCVVGNHEDKLARALAGRNVRRGHGLELTLEQLAEREAAEPGFTDRVRAFLAELPDHLRLAGGELVVAHAGLPERYHGRTSRRARAHALYGATTGGRDEYGLPVRLPWAEDHRGAAEVVYGHTPVLRARWVNRTICLDTGCVFGGELTALRWPEREVVSVPAEREWCAPVRPLAEG